MSDISDALLPINQQVRRKLREERLRTGISARVLLTRRQDIPAGLRASHVSRWANGLTKQAPAGHVEYILQLWASVRDDAGRVDKSGTPIARPGKRYPKAGEHWVTITDDMRDSLRLAVKDSGLTVTQLLKLEDAPPELTRRMLTSWLYGNSSTVRQNLWDFVIGGLKFLSDTSNPNRSSYLHSVSRHEIDAAELAELRYHRERTGVGGTILLRNATDKPPGLTATMISSWTNGITKTANAAHVAFVLGRYRKWP